MLNVLRKSDDAISLFDPVIVFFKTKIKRASGLAYVGQKTKFTNKAIDTSGLLTALRRW